MYVACPATGFLKEKEEQRLLCLNGLRIQTQQPFLLCVLGKCDSKSNRNFKN